MRGLALLLLLLPAASAAVDGVVVNGTTGKPQPGATVTLHSLDESGMKPVSRVKTDARGEFRMDQSPQGPHLLQAAYAGVTYNLMLHSGAKTTGLELEVFNSSNNPSGATVSQHMVFIQPMGGILHVNEIVLYQNSGKVTYNDPAEGTLQVLLPEEMRGDPRLTVTGPQGMPLEGTVTKTAVAGVYKIDSPVTPGETRFDLTYVLSMPASGVFAGKVLHDGASVRLVAPLGVTLRGEGITMTGQDPATQAMVYEVQGNEYAVEIEGSGQLGTPEPAEAQGGAGIESIRPPIYDRMHEILGLSLLILLLGFILLYRRGTGAAPAVGASPRGERR